MPTRPGLTIGISRCFWSVACVHTAASPNEVKQEWFLLLLVERLRLASHPRRCFSWVAFTEESLILRCIVAENHPFVKQRHITCPSILALIRNNCDTMILYVKQVFTLCARIEMNYALG